jgi:hypothetical protein
MTTTALLYLVKTNSGLWREVSEHEYDDSLGIKQIAVPVLPVSTEYDWALVRTDDGARLIDNPDKQGHLAQARRLSALEAAMAGVTQEMLDGGWSARGLSKYARSLEDQITSKGPK